MDNEIRSFSNCFFFAIELWIRRLAKGERGYVKWRMSDYGPFPHFIYERRDPTGKLREVSYVPNDPIPRNFPPPIFPGHVKWGDAPKPKQQTPQ